MPQADPNYNLYVLNPGLIKEWHPTRNAGIRPQEITPGSGKKIWWLCNQGHEWQAVVYSRSRGSGCPICNRQPANHVESRGTGGSYNGLSAAETDSMLEIEPPERIFGADFRKIKRFKTNDIVTIEVPSSHHLFYAQMKNFSHEGMCLETSTALTPGTKVIIKLGRPLYARSPRSYDSIIKWCQGLSDEEGAIYNFGLGLQFI